MILRAGVSVLLLTILGTPIVSAQTDQIDKVTWALQATAFSYGAHPESRAEDIYKSLHQALFGPGHAIPDREAVWQLLLDEVSILGPPIEADRLCEALGGEPRIVRVNLRPFIARGEDLEALFEAFVATAEEVHGSPSDMDRALQTTESWLQSVSEPELADELDRLRVKMAKKGFPAVHHSQIYVQTYKPAYRIVTAIRADEYGWCR